MKKFDFTKAEHIKSNDEFQKLFVSGQRIHTESLTLLYKQNNLECNRLGIAVSKKRFKKNSLRNRLRRLVREAYRHNKINFTKQGFDFIIICKQLSPEEKYQDIEEKVIFLFRKAGFLL